MYSNDMKRVHAASLMSCISGLILPGSHERAAQLSSADAFATSVETPR